MQNELAYLDWPAFRQRAPGVVRLEVRRLDDLLRQGRDDAGLCEGLLAARAALLQFVACVRAAERGGHEICAPHLRRALLILSLETAARDGPAAAPLAYLVDRLRYVHDQFERVY